MKKTCEIDIDMFMDVLCQLTGSLAQGVAQVAELYG